MSMVSSRALSHPGWLRSLISNRALTVSGTNRFAKTANLTLREALGQITLARAIRRLPPLKPGHVRLTHKTSKADISKVTNDGLRYIGQISSSAFCFKTAEAAAYYLKTSQHPGFDKESFSYPREMAVVIDLPLTEFERHNQFREWGEPSSFIVDAKYIVQIIDTSQQSQYIRSTQPKSKVMG